MDLVIYSQKHGSLRSSKISKKTYINRRRFLAGLGGSAAAFALPGVWPKCLLAAVPRQNNIITPRARVGIARSEAGKCEDLAFTDIMSVVEQAVNLAGGLEGIVRDKQVVVLKPNLMCLYVNSTGQKLAPDVNGVTTDWRVTRAVAQIVRKLNPHGKIYVMESSAFQQTRTTMVALNYTPDKIPEVDGFFCLEESGSYEQWDSPQLTTVTLPKGVGLYPDYMKPNKSPQFYFNKDYYNADVIISIPVLKNHHYTGLTGAIKNVAIGASPPNIYGSKSQLTVTQATPQYIVDKWGPLINLMRVKKIDHRPYYLGSWIHDYYLCRPVDFVVTDGLQGSQNGPDIPHTTKQKCLEDNQMNMRLILAGRDAVAVDTVHSLTIGFDPDKVNHLVNLSTAGCMNPAFIRVEGSAVHSVRKFFAMEWERGGAAKHNCSKNPDLKIKAAVKNGDKLYLRLAVDAKETVKLEVALDGKLLDKTVIDGFENVSFQLSGRQAAAKNVTVFAYDRYLNCTEQTVTVG